MIKDSFCAFYLIICFFCYQAQLENKGEEQTNSSPVIKIKEAIKKITVKISLRILI